MIIEMDTRNQVDNYVTDYLDKNNIKWIRNKLYSGDVKLLNDTRVIIDLKKDINEIASNLCRTLEHQRLKREIERAREIGCERFIFMVKVKDITCVDEIIKWKSKYSKVKPETLIKIIKTFSERYNVEFMFYKKEEMGQKIVELLTNN